MKIRLSELRKLIREVVESDLEEMALASISKTVRDPRNKTTKKGYGDKDESDEDYRAVDRFHHSPKFTKETESTFSLVGIPVHIIPVYTSKSIRGRRTGVVPLEQALPVIEEAGFDAEKLAEELAGGACVILTHSRSLVKNLLPTSWMMLHAFFDDQGSRGPIGKAASSVENFIAKSIDKGRDLGLSLNEITYGLLGTLSMKSARDGNLNVDSLNDWAAELCTQATRRSAVPRTYTNDKLSPEKVEIINELGKELHDFVNSLNVREIVESYLRGNVIYVDVANFENLN